MSRHRPPPPPPPPKSTLEPYNLAPPSWRPPLIIGRDTEKYGYPLFYPTLPAQEENSLSEPFVKSGYANKPFVTTESFSAHQMIYTNLMTGSLANVSKLSNLIAQRVLTLTPTILPAAFRCPHRVTLNDAKRQAWVNDLANPTVPISKLYKFFPHTSKGEKLILLLQERQVPVSRALWYIRALGSSDIHGQLKARQVGTTAVISAYSREQTLVMLEFLKKQITELASLLSESKDLDTRRSRLTYTLELMQGMYSENLFDQELFLHLLISQVESASLPQLGFYLLLAQDYACYICRSEVLGSRLVFYAFGRLEEIEKNVDYAIVKGPLKDAVASIVRTVFLLTPSSFMPITFWTKYATRLEGIFSQSPEIDFKGDLADLEERHETTLQIIQDGVSIEPDELNIIKILDEIAFPTSLEAVHAKLFKTRRRRQPIQNDLSIFFTWATSPSRAGSHRVYAISTLLLIEFSKQDEKEDEDEIDVEACFINWIDTCATDKEATARLLGELIRVQVMSYSVYLQKMIARGETEKTAEESPHMYLLQSVPLFGQLARSKKRLNPCPSEMDSLNTVVQCEIERLFARPLPEPLLGVTDELPVQNFDLLFISLATLVQSGNYLSITRQFIPDMLVSLLAKNEQPTALDSAVICQIYIHSGDYWGLQQVLLLLLSSSPTRELFSHLLDVIQSFLLIWTCIGSLPLFGEKLWNCHVAFKASGAHDRRLVGILRELAAGNFLGSAEAAQLDADYKRHITSLTSTKPATQPLPPNIAELHSLKTDTTPASIAQLATTIWWRYHNQESWGNLVLDSVLRLLPQLMVTTAALFLREISDRLPTGLEPCLIRWVATSSSHGLIGTIAGSQGRSIKELIEILVLEGSISSSIAVSSFLIPCWSALLNRSTKTVLSVDEQEVHARGFEILASIFQRLVGFDPLLETVGTFTATSLLLQHKYLSRRSDLYTRQNLPDIGRCLAFLSVSESIFILTPLMYESQVLMCQQLRKYVGADASFRMSVARDPQVLASAILDSPCITKLGEGDLRLGLLASLLELLTDDDSNCTLNFSAKEGWDSFLTGLTIWRLDISRVEVQASLEKLELDKSLTEKEKQEALNALSQYFLDRVCAGEGHTYLGEQIVKCYHGRASDELVCVAFTRLAKALGEFSDNQTFSAQTLTTLRCVGRLLSTLFETSPAYSRPEQLTELLRAIYNCLEIVKEKQPKREVVLFLVHLIRVALRCAPDQETESNPLPEWVGILQNSLAPIVKLVQVMSSSLSKDSDVILTLLDTCSDILFLLAPQGKNLSEVIDFAALDLAVLPEYALKRLHCLFPTFQHSPLVSPWDLLEPPEVVGLGPNDPRLNTGPIDLQLFHSKLLHIFSAPPTQELLKTTSQTQNSNVERGLQSNFDWEVDLAGMSVEAVDWRRTLMLSGVKGMISSYNANPQAPNQKEKDTDEGVVTEASKYEKKENTQTSTIQAPQTRTSKRKADIEILDSDDDVPAAPVTRSATALNNAPATRRKPASKSTSARGRKKPKTG